MSKTKRISLVIPLFWCLVIALLSFNQGRASEVVKPFVVVLDAGHGGHDPGNVGNGYREKDIALAIVLKIGKILEAQPNVKVIYTRKSDTFVDLFVRGKIANNAKADLFVSVHCDAHDSNAYGSHTFVLGLHRSQTNFNVAKRENSVIYLENDFKDRYAQYDINSPESTIGLTIMQEEFLDQSVMLAQFIQNNFAHKLGRKDRKVKQAGFIVLHQTFMPSVLVESGFLTNKTEGAYLNSKKGQSEMGGAIADAIIKYHKTILGSSVSDSSQTYAPSSEASSRSVGQVSSNGSSRSSQQALDESSAVEFRIQIAASSKILALKPYNFKGLSVLSESSEGNLHRYYYGKTNSYSKAKNLLVEAKKAGFSSAYIVAFKSGELYPLQKALQSGSKQ